MLVVLVLFMYQAQLYYTLPLCGWTPTYFSWHNHNVFLFNPHSLPRVHLPRREKRLTFQTSHDPRRGASSWRW